MTRFVSAMHEPLNTSPKHTHTHTTPDTYAHTHRRTHMRLSSDFNPRVKSKLGKDYIQNVWRGVGIRVWDGLGPDLVLPKFGTCECVCVCERGRETYTTIPLSLSLSLSLCPHLSHRTLFLRAARRCQREPSVDRFHLKPSRILVCS